MSEDLQYHRRECEKREEAKKETERQEAELKELLKWLEDEVKRVVTRESHEDSKPILLSKDNHDGSESMQMHEDKCYEVVAAVSIPRLFKFFYYAIAGFEDKSLSRGGDKSLSSSLTRS